MTVPPVLLLFESGAISGPYSWTWVERRLPNDVAVVNRDRGAPSLFDAAYRRMDYRSVLERLRPHLLDGVPVVAIGHSIGGLLVRAHANALGSRVVGMVLVDPSPPSQFAPGVDQDFQYLRLNQSLAVRTVRAVFGQAPTAAETADFSNLSAAARTRAVEMMTPPRYWMNAYRESRSAGSQWLGSALFPDVEQRPVAVVSSDVSAHEHSLQNTFEERILHGSSKSQRFRVEGASHATVLFDEQYSRAVNEAIDWVLTQVVERRIA
ncbi:alpha/beta hydrolase [Microbacterium sp. NPDC091662]|uniref:alpha/beta hydrolase n=1 Tax=Microbacterium sp. NPDC091662 TaxID=3364211 RepID=UPI0037F8FD83